MNEIIVQIASKDRAGEVGLLLTSLLNQTNTEFDIIMLDDGSNVPLTSFYFINELVVAHRLKGHQTDIVRNNAPSGVSSARQQLVDLSMKKPYKYFVRIDDDSIVESDYLEQLIRCIDCGYDIASGVVPGFGQLPVVRETKFVEPIIGEVVLDKEGNILYNGDDCGCLYSEDAILPSHHFRSCAMFKREVFESGVNYNSRLSRNGFREEQIISFKAICKGFKIGCNTGAIAWHLQTPSGGERDTMHLGQFNQQVFEETTKRLFKDYGNFIEDYNKRLGIVSRVRATGEYLKSSNLTSIKPVYNLLK
jgi:glycosyltransferase involved in cell wall biosynthesis